MMIQKRSKRIFMSNSRISSKCFLLILLVQLGMSAFNNATCQNIQRPNIIIVLADDLGWGDLGCNGQQKIKTPNLDKMAKEGIKFNQFYAGSAICAPSRAVLLTGINTAHSHRNSADWTVEKKVDLLDEGDVCRGVKTII